MVEHLRSTVIFFERQKISDKSSRYIWPTHTNLTGILQDLWESDLTQKSKTMQQALDNIADLLSDKSVDIDVGNMTRIKNYPRLHIVLYIAIPTSQHLQILS